MNRFLAMVAAPLLAFAIIAAGWNTAGDDGGAAAKNPPTTHKLTVKKINNQWKVVLSDTTKTEVRAKPGDKIEWTAEGSDMYFQFLDTNLFGGFTKTVKNGKTLTLSVGNAAKKGVNYYAVFCTASNEYATGGSPPKIIIE